MTEILDITLEYSLVRLEEAVIDEIMARQLSLQDKLAILTSQNETFKKQILLGIGYRSEFIETL